MSQCDQYINIDNLTTILPSCDIICLWLPTIFVHWQDTQKRIPCIVIFHRQLKYLDAELTFDLKCLLIDFSYYFYLCSWERSLPSHHLVSLGKWTIVSLFMKMIPANIQNLCLVIAIVILCSTSSIM